MTSVGMTRASATHGRFSFRGTRYASGGERGASWTSRYLLDLTRHYLMYHVFEPAVLKERRAGHRGTPKFVLVVDEHATRVLSPCFLVSDLCAGCHVTLIERLEAERQPLDLPAIYLCLPTSRNLATVLSDLRKPTYPRYYISFLEPINDEIEYANEFEARVRSAPGLVGRIRQLRELDMSFVPNESQVFTLNMRNDAKYLFADHRRINSDDQTFGYKDQVLVRVAERLATLCVVLGQEPSIYFQREVRQQGSANPALEENPAKDLAIMLKSMVSAYRHTHSLTSKKEADTKIRVVILDRSLDPVSPLLHEVTYQAMLHDLLELNYDEEAGNVSQDVDRSQLKYWLNESDSFWLSVRHLFFSEFVSDPAYLPLARSRVKKFDELRQTFSSGQSQTATSAQSRRFADLLLQVKDIAELKKQFKYHVNLATQCQTRFEKWRIAHLMELEQELIETAARSDFAGNLNSVMDRVGLRTDPRIIARITEFLDSNKALRPADRIRLLLLYVLLHRKMTSHDLRGIDQHFKLGGDLTRCVSGMEKMLGRQLVGSDAREGGGGGYRLPKRQCLHTVPTSTGGEITTWVPQVGHLMRQMGDGKIDHDTLEKAALSKGISASTASLGRIAESAADMTRSGGLGHKHLTNNTQRPARNLYVFFVLGGITLSEMKCAYDLTARHQGRARFFLGSTHISTPAEFIEDIKRITHL